MIELRNLSKVFGGPRGEQLLAVNEVSLTVATGSTLCLIGTSGCGKTTCMKMINRLLEPTSGEVLLDDRSVGSRDIIELRRSIGYVIQKGGLFPHMTASQNVGLLCELEGWALKKREARVEELLDLVNLPMKEFGDRHPHELSGGQKKRVGVARTLALDPPFMLMDEPFGALDPITRKQLHAEFKRLQATVNKTTIIVTHDMAEAFELGTTVAIMDEGRLLQHGTERDFRERPRSEFVARFLESHLGGSHV